MSGLAGLFDFGTQRAEIGFEGVAGDVGLFHPDHGAGDDPDAAFIGHGGSEAGERDADAHAALYDRGASDEIADAQSWKRHEEPPRGLCMEFTGGGRLTSRCPAPGFLVEGL